MTARNSWRWAVATASAVAIVTALGAYLMVRNHASLYGNDYFLWGLFTAASIAYVVAGLAIVRLAPARVIGWLCLLIAGALELSLSLTQYAIYGLKTNPASLPSPGLAAVIASTMPLITLTGIILVLHLFPTGHPVGPRWRVFVAMTILSQIIVAVTTLLSTDPVTDVWSDELSHAGVTATNPIGVSGIRSDALPAKIAILLFVVGAVAAITSLFVRRRRATRDERLQLRWLAAVAGAAAVWLVVMLPLTIASPNGPVGGIFWLVITPLVALGPPIAIGIGIVKYRLFDIDVVIRKAVVVTIVAVALTGLYLAVLALATVGRVSRVVVGLALLAVTFNPVRRAARSIADRVAYGRRASSYEVLSDFSERVAETYASDDVLTRMASILAAGTGARSATVWLRLGGELVPAATSGDGAPEAVPFTGDDLPPLPGAATEVHHQDELLGAFSVVMPENDPLDPARERLIRDLASQAGLVLRNAALIEDLRRSRQRLVAAQDEERRKIERNLHDGAQQQLVALAVQLKLARTFVVGTRRAREDALDGPPGSATSALEDLRDLARGIYPPLLADKGLAAALDAQARKAAVPVTVDSESLGRYPREVESTLYFCALEALNNVAKYAEASVARVHLAQRTAASRSRSRTTAAASIPTRPATGPACRAWPTGWPHSAGRSGSDRHPAPGQPSPGPSRRDRRRRDRSRTSGHRGDDLVTRRTASILAWGSCALSVLFVVLSIVVTARNAPTGPTAYGPDIALSVPATAGFGLVLLSFAVIGALIAVRRPDNGVGWLFCAIGLADSFFNLAGSVEAHGLVTNPGSMAGAAWFGLASDALWLPFIATTTVFLFLLFPEGRPVGQAAVAWAIGSASSRWRSRSRRASSHTCTGSTTSSTLCPFRLSSGLSVRSSVRGTPS